ncbi:MAG: DUF4294 domain-containing protein [Alistipes sp.]|nr:DUF4294 domain-containing protein [Alistipes sp.]
MKRCVTILLLAMLLVLSIEPLAAQSRRQRVRGASSVRWEIDERGDSTLHITLRTVPVFHRMRDLKEYRRMIKAVKKVYPLAVEAARRMEDLDERLAEFERRKDRKAYTKALEEALKEELAPMLWKMTRYEGKILLKLIDRETDHTAFNIIKEFRSGFTAGFYQMIAKMFGNNLKLEYDPDGDDEMLEQIVLYYKAGLLD